MEGVALLGLVIMLLVTAGCWPLLPDRVPQHFDTAGRPDAWGPRGLLLTLPLVSAVLYLFLSALSLFPHWFNYVWPITQENARAQYLLARQLLVAMKAYVVWTFGWMLWATIRTALGRGSGLGAAFLPVDLVAVFAMLAVYLVHAYRSR
jgi:uncharacterized membrane protein